MRHPHADAERRLCEVEPRFAPWVLRAGPCTLRRRRDFDPFPALAEAIVSQQLSGRAAATIFARIPALYGAAEFPAAERVAASPPGFLRPAGVSRAKDEAIRDLAARVLDGTVPDARTLHRMEDEAVVERLTRVRGIGRWTVQMLLLFDLGRPDVFPVADLGVRKGYERVFGRRGATPAAMTRRAEKWRPHRSVASWYLWRALDGTREG